MDREGETALKPVQVAMLPARRAAEAVRWAAVPVPRGDGKPQGPLEAQAQEIMVAVVRVAQAAAMAASGAVMEIPDRAAMDRMAVKALMETTVTGPMVSGYWSVCRGALRRPRAGVQVAAVAAAAVAARAVVKIVAF